jgi:hypothetical protein
MSMLHDLLILTSLTALGAIMMLAGMVLISFMVLWTMGLLAYSLFDLLLTLILPPKRGRG